MFELDNLFLESVNDYDDDIDTALTVTDEGFIWCECNIDESNVIDGDPFEFITEAMYQNIVNANNISLAILADNYKYLRENGVELMTEASAKSKQNEGKLAAIKRFFEVAKNKVIEFFMKILEKMKRLQAKFLMLFKKAQARAKSNYNQVLKDIDVPDYHPDDVVKWAKNQFKSLESSDTSKPFTGEGKKRKVTFNTELQIIKEYGKYIKQVNELKKEFIDFMNKAEKKELSKVKDPTDYARATDPLGAAANDKATTKDAYARLVNAGTLIAKNAVNYIMYRVNVSAQIINKAVFAKKSEKENKKSVGESATYLDRLEMM